MVVAKVTRRVRLVQRRVARVVERFSAPGRIELRVLVEPDIDDGGFIAGIVGLPGVRSQGETEREAVANVIDALACYVQAQADEQSPHSAASVGSAHEHRIRVPALA